MARVARKFSLGREFYQVGKIKRMHIAVIGSGFVGLLTGACFAEFGVVVTCVDVDAEKIAQLALGKMTIYEPVLDHIVKKNLQAGRLLFTTGRPSSILHS